MVYWPSETLRDRPKKTHSSLRSAKYERVQRLTLETENVVLLGNGHTYKHDSILNVRWTSNGSI